MNYYPVCTCAVGVECLVTLVCQLFGLSPLFGLFRHSRPLQGFTKLSQDGFCEVFFYRLCGDCLIVVSGFLYITRSEFLCGSFNSDCGVAVLAVLSMSALLCPYQSQLSHDTIRSWF